MSRKYVKMFCAGLFSCALLTSCGGADSGGGIGEFNTVTVSATTASPRLESDVLTGNTCTDGDSTGGTYSTDTVNVVLTSTATAATNNSPVFIDSVTVSFVPNNSLSTSAPPALDNLYSSVIGTTIASGGTLTLPVAVAPEALKVKLVNTNKIGICGGKIWAYYVTISFEVLEQYTGTRRKVTTSMDVIFADRV